MEYRKIEGVKYQVFTHKTMTGEKETFVSTDNKGKFVKSLETGKTEKLTIAFEGINYFHLGSTVVKNPCKLANKKLFKLVK